MGQDLPRRIRTRMVSSQCGDDRDGGDDDRDDRDDRDDDDDDRDDQDSTPTRLSLN